MNRGIVILIAAAVTAAFLIIMVAYVDTLDQQPPLIEAEKKGRAKYLIDTRWPFINLEVLFSPNNE